MKKQPSLAAARTTATLTAPYGQEGRLVGKPYHALSHYERSSILCSPIDWQTRLVELASRVEPPNTSLIAAIGGAADKLAFEAQYSADEIRQSAGRFGLSANKQSEIARLEMQVQANQGLSEVAIVTLEAIASRS